MSDVAVGVSGDPLSDSDGVYHSDDLLSDDSEGISDDSDSDEFDIYNIPRYQSQFYTPFEVACGYASDEQQMEISDEQDSDDDYIVMRDPFREALSEWSD